MRTVLGIDAAWTLTEPSGIALIKETATHWELIAAEASYQRFLAKADPTLSRETLPSGSSPEPDKLIEAAKSLCGTAPDLVAVDMPLARSRIIGRRASDRAVSRAYGARQCGTHSPSAVRPGIISDRFTESFRLAGYTLCTGEIITPALIEVYPHPALVEITNAEKRLPYKLAKISRYWPGITLQEESYVCSINGTRSQN